MYSSRTTHSIMQRQRGAVFIVMLVIMIMGVTFFLVSALSKVSLQTARNEKSSDMLAQAKEVVIGNTVAGIGGQRPGDTLRPDSFSTTEAPPDYDGTAETGCLDVNNAPIGLPLTTTVANMRCLGRLPWKDFKLPVESPSENDPTGFMPWYAVSTNLLDPVGVTFNSELLNTAPHPWLTVHDMNGNVVSNRVAFVIIIPGAALPGQSRPTSPNLGSANQYLDSITVPAGCTVPCTPNITYKNYDPDDDFIMGDEHRWIDDPANPGKQIEDPTYSFNDKLLYVTIDELMPLIEKRIAREVKRCLDSYADTSNGKYPWAAPASDPAVTGTYGTLFGRVSTSPNTSTSAGTNPAATTLNSALNALQTALDNYFAVGNAANRTILINAGNYVISLKNSIASPPAPPGFSNTIDTAGDWAKEFAFGMHSYASVTQKITDALNAVAPLITPADSGMPTIWPTSCTLFASTYWAGWQNLVFYQIADGYKPGTITPSCGNCLTINGSGNTNGGNGTYRAAIIVAGKMTGIQTRSTAPDIQNRNNYLEGLNTIGKTDIPTTYNFETYKTSDSSYQSTTNDLVLCLDGKNNCK